MRTRLNSSRRRGVRQPHGHAHAGGRAPRAAPRPDLGAARTLHRGLAVSAVACRGRPPACAPTPGSAAWRAGDAALVTLRANSHPSRESVRVPPRGQRSAASARALCRRRSDDSPSAGRACPRALVACDCPALRRAGRAEWVISLQRRHDGALVHVALLDHLHDGADLHNLIAAGCGECAAPAPVSVPRSHPSLCGGRRRAAAQTNEDTHRYDRAEVQTVPWCAHGRG